MQEFSLLLAIIVFWIVLNRWILPWFGIPTCMSGGCAAAHCRSRSSEPSNPVDKDA